jgi:hypothetical protein
MKKLLLLLVPLAVHAAIILDATTKSVRFSTSAATNMDYHASYADITTTAMTPTAQDGQATTATTTTVVTAPAASTQRQVKSISIVNTSTTTANTVTALLTISGTDRQLFPSVTLAPDESLQYEDGAGWYVLDAVGRRKASAADTTGVDGRSFDWYKSGTAAEAAGSWYSWSKDSGFPGALAIGTPGLGGRTIDGTTTTDAGCMVVANASSGGNYLASVNATGTVAHNLSLHDWLWVNTGAVVTTTTGQTVTSVTWPARDSAGTTNGSGVNVGILVTTATTNASAVTNTTMTYTNSDGTGSRTATIASFPATAVIGTFVPFQLQAGDRGVRSIQTLTLGTSYAAGAISLVAYRTIIGQPMTLANVGSPAGQPIMNPGVRIYDGTCLMPVGIMSATTATTIAGSGVVLQR